VSVTELMRISVIKETAGNPSVYTFAVFKPALTDVLLFSAALFL